MTDRAPYWVHSDPEAPKPTTTTTADMPDLDEYLLLVQRACPGECNTGWRRIHKRALAEWRMAYATADEPEPYAPDVRLQRRALARLVTGEPTWCPVCQDDIRRAVAALPGLGNNRALPGYGKLQPAQASEIKPTSRATPSPSPAFDLADQIARWPVAWVQELANVTGQTLAPTCMVLLGHWSAVMEAPFARPFGKDALQMHRRALVALGLDDLVHTYPKHGCIDCGVRALSRKDGGEHVVCGACGASWPWQWFEEVALGFNSAATG